MPAPFGLPAELAELQDDYELIGELGRGGAAVVYRARDRALGREVAVKVVHPRPTSPDDDPVARLGREARTVAQLQHPNIVAVYAVRRLRSGGLALVMQCVPGATLKAHVRRHGPLAPDECERLLRDVGAALAYAHARGVVHRDVKPENIFLDERTGRALLADFGIARSADADSMTMTGTAVGTPFYMSPEQVEGAPLDGRSDLYSLGLVAWEALTGRRPWDGESLYNVIYKQKHDELPPIEALRPGVPLRLQYVVERMLQKRPAARWAGAEGLLGQLEHAVLPGDYGQWQRALGARVARYHDDERRRATERPAPPAGAGGRGAPPDSSPAAGADTVQFTRADLFDPADGADAQLANTFAVPIAGPAAGPSAAPGTAEPRSDDLLPAPGSTRELRASAADDPLLPAAVAPTYADAAEPTWLAAPSDPAIAPAPVVGRRRTLYAAAAVVAVGGAFALYARGDGYPTGEPARAYAADAPPTVPVVPPRTAASAPGHETVGGRPAAASGASEVTLLSAGGRHSCAATAAGTLHCWGANDRGQLGDGTQAPRSGPGAVAGALSFTSVSAGLAHSCAVTRLGDVYCWGSDRRGQLGDATTVHRDAPVRVAGVGTYASVSAGGVHSCGVTRDGAVRCWGANDQGQLGDGTRESRTVPTPVRLDGVAVTRVAAGGQHTCAIGDDGRVRCWGGNRDGQLGDVGLGDSRTTPVAVPLPASAIAISAGLAHSCALTVDGAVWCWGRNDSGQTGAGSPTARSGPTRVRVAGATLRQLASGAAHNCALDAGGGAWCWGRNTRGAVGDGSTTNRPAPIRVRLPSSAVAVAAGTAHSCATLADGRTFCWGDNLDGQLGDATRAARLSPVAVHYPAGVTPLVTAASARAAQ
jgi:alpha-tubulin suppressor-like RCC1 family protein